MTTTIELPDDSDAPAPSPGRALAEQLLATTALGGPYAARDVARQHAAIGHHSHLSADGEVECLSRMCAPTTLHTGA